MKKTIYSITKNTSLAPKDLESTLFEAADLWLYLEPQLKGIVPSSVLHPVRTWMRKHKDVLQTLANMKVEQIKRSGADDLYLQLYKTRFLPERFRGEEAEEAETTENERG